MKQSFEITLGAKTLVFETGKIAKQAGGACTVTCGDSIVLVTACATPEPKTMDYLPLMVEYREKSYAAGKIPGGFFKREGRPYDKETLTSRLIDRPIRPLFDEWIRHDIQIIAAVLSADEENEPDVLAINGASLAVALFPIPWHGPLGAVRVGLIGGEYVINPTHAELKNSRLNLVICATAEKIVMIAGEAAEATEEEAVAAVQAGFKEAVRISQAIAAFAADAPKLEIPRPVRDDDFERPVKEFLAPLVRPAIDVVDKSERHLARAGLLTQARERFAPNDDDADKRTLIDKLLYELEEIEIRKMALVEGKRQDGRAFNQLRPISADVAVLPRAHGSAVFTRGQTQALVATTLGTVSDEQKIEDLMGERTKAFMLHYNFPPFSVGEVKPIRGAGRREIGHGALAESAFLHILPGEDEFPYTIRVVSDILESNGSSSMASVCGASLSLMDAGIPIKKAVAGISIGLFTDGVQNKILTDIQGLEDYYGDMDFKVAGTRDGVTAIQLDMKVRGVDVALVADALAQARTARLDILDQMDAVLGKPRSDLSPYAPRIYIIFVDVEKIGTVIGPGGKMIRRIIAETGVEIDIEDDGKVTIASPDEPSARRAIEMVKALGTNPEIGAVYTGKVTRLMKFGVFVEIAPGVEGMVHISQLDAERVERVEDFCKVGDEIQVKVVELDDMGRINLSRKVLLPGHENSSGKVERPSRGGRREGSRDGRSKDGPRRDRERYNKKDRE